jgi:hypothetical protein
VPNAQPRFSESSYGVDAACVAMRRGLCPSQTAAEVSIHLPSKANQPRRLPSSLAAATVAMARWNVTHVMDSIDTTP